MPGEKKETRRFGPEEEELKRRIAEGDEGAFARLFHQYYNLLRPFVWKFTRRETDAEEILQETFIRVWLNRDKITGIENLRGWIFTIASRICLTHIRKTLNDQKKTG